MKKWNCHATPNKWTIWFNNPAVIVPGEMLQIKYREPSRRHTENDLPTEEVYFQFLSVRN